MIVSHQNKHPTVGARSGKVAVSQRVSRSVNSRALGVPHGKYPVIETVTSPARLLSSPNRCCREILVDSRKKTDIARFKLVIGECQLLIQGAKR